MNSTPVNFGTSFLTFVQENIGPDKKLLIVEDLFIKYEFSTNLDDALLELSANQIPCNKIKGDGRAYLAIADTQVKIDQYLSSEVEGEFEATILEFMSS